MNKTTTGPLGIMQTDDQAFETERVLLAYKGESLRHLSTISKNEVDGNRTETSVISTNAVNRYRIVVLSSGMEDSVFALNPIVTMNHRYDLPAVGRSVARLQYEDRIEAKTFYPPAPEEMKDSWTPSAVLNFIKAGLMNAKSIGFVGKADSLTKEEREKYPGAEVIFRKWSMIEYAVCSIGVNQEAMTKLSWLDMLDEDTIRGLIRKKLIEKVKGKL